MEFHDVDLKESEGVSTEAKVFSLLHKYGSGESVVVGDTREQVELVYDELEFLGNNLVVKVDCEVVLGIADDDSQVENADVELEQEEMGNYADQGHMREVAWDNCLNIQIDIEASPD